MQVLWSPSEFVWLIRRVCTGYEQYLIKHFKSSNARIVVWFVNSLVLSSSRLWHFDWMWIRMADDACIKEDPHPVGVPGWILMTFFVFWIELVLVQTQKLCIDLDVRLVLSYFEEWQLVNSLFKRFESWNSKCGEDILTMTLTMADQTKWRIC